MILAYDIYRVLPLSPPPLLWVHPPGMSPPLGPLPAPRLLPRIPGEGGPSPVWGEGTLSCGGEGDPLLWGRGTLSCVGGGGPPCVWGGDPFFCGGEGDPLLCVGRGPLLCGVPRPQLTSLHACCNENGSVTVQHVPSCRVTGSPLTVASPAQERNWGVGISRTPQERGPPPPGHSSLTSVSTARMGPDKIVVPTRPAGPCAGLLIY